MESNPAEMKVVEARHLNQIFCPNLKYMSSAVYLLRTRYIFFSSRSQQQRWEGFNRPVKILCIRFPVPWENQWSLYNSIALLASDEGCAVYLFCIFRSDNNMVNVEITGVPVNTRCWGKGLLSDDRCASGYCIRKINDTIRASLKGISSLAWFTRNISGS